MAEVLKKGESAMPSSSGLKSPGQLSGLTGPNPVLDNRWGNKLGKGNGNNSMKGSKK